MFGFYRRPPDPEAVDLSSKRSIQIRQRSEDAFTVDYFYHAGKYWTARIPFRVLNVFGQSFNFSKVRTRRGKSGTEIVHDERGQPKPVFSFINHLQTRFRVDPSEPVALYELHSELSANGLPQGEPAYQLPDFIYSIEATGLPGVEFDFVNGLRGNLLCMHRFLSAEEMVFERVVVQGQYVWESASLAISDDDKRRVLMKSLERSDQAGVEEVYYLYRCWGTNNCTSNPFQIVDECVEYSLWQRLGSLAYRFPLNPRLYLRIRGLDSNPNHVKLVRTDYEAFISDPDTQQRKRNVVRRIIQQRRKSRDESQSEEKDS